MNSEVNSQPKQISKRSRRLIKFLKIFSIIVLFLIIAGVFSNWIWVRSGSNKWELVDDRDGTVVHKLKVPGSFVLQLKAMKRMKTTLEGLVSAMQDVDAMCTDGCADAKVIKWVKSPDKQIVYTYSVFDMPFPLTDREWVLENTFSYDPETKGVLYKVNAAPYIVPNRNGYIRITHFNNQWRFIPVKNGEVDVEWQIDMNYGGFGANLFHNLIIPLIMPESLNEIEKISNDKKYQNAKFSFIHDTEQVDK